MKKFELCFQIPGTQRYIVPELLRPGRPDFQWDYAGNLRFEYRYEFMPAGIITRFIVRTHDMTKRDMYWKNGVLLERENTDALVISEPLNRKIRIWIRGENRKELLAIIRREIDHIHETLNNPDVKQMIPCICRECEHSPEPYFHNYADLIKAKQKGKRQIECKKSFESISIDKLLGEYEVQPEQPRAVFERDFGLRDTQERPYVSFQQTFVSDMHPHEETEKPGNAKSYRRWKVIWAIIGGIILILGGIWTGIQIYEHFRNSQNKTGIEQKLMDKKPSAGEKGPRADANSPG